MKTTFSQISHWLVLLVFFSPMASAQHFLMDWQRDIAGELRTYGRDVAVDHEGNVVIVGSFQGQNADFGGVSYSSVEQSDIFIAKYTHDNQLLWVKKIGAEWNDEARSVGIDSEGNIFVFGNFSGIDVDFDPDNDQASLFSSQIDWMDTQDIFLMKYSGEGRLLWGKVVGDLFTDHAGDLYVDKNGDVYITGEITGITDNEVDFDPGATDNPDRFIPPASFGSAYFAKYNSNGKLIWVTSTKSAISNRGWSIHADAAGNVFTVGSFYGSKVYFKHGSTDPAHMLSSAESGDFGAPTDIFICKHDKNGELQWVNGIGQADWDYAFGVTTDDSGAVYVTGLFTGTEVDFDPQGNMDKGRISSQKTDMFLARYFPDGQLDWVKAIGGNTDRLESGFDVVSNSFGEVYVAGQFAGENVDFGGKQATSNDPDEMDAFFAVYQQDGTLKDLVTWGEAEEDSPRGIALNDAGEVYISGCSGTRISGEGAPPYMDNVTLSKFAPGADPMIRVTGNGKVIINNDHTPDKSDHTDLGEALPGMSSSSTFEIENLSNAPLVIGSIYITGDALGEFEIDKDLPFTIEANSKSAFTTVFTPTGEGLRTVTVVISTNEPGSTDYRFSLQASGVVSITGLPGSNDGWKVYPVPGNGKLFIKGSNLRQCNKIMVKVHSLDGRNVSQHYARRQGETFELDVHHLPKGSYMLRFTDENYRPFSRLIILH